MGSVLAGIRGKLGSYTPKQLVAAGLLVAIVLAGSLGLYRWMTEPTYDVLFAGLSSSDAAAVVDAVEAAGVPYKLTEAGATSTILVPLDAAPRLRLSLAGENLPGDSVAGYELLDTQGVTVSTFREQVNYQRALEGELARTLMSIDGVSSASVHIVLPQDRLYTEDETPSTASVTLTTATSLDDDQVAAVTHLVSASVPGLAPAQVTVTDAGGQLLSKEGGSSAGGTEQEVEASYAQRLETRAASMLDSIVGTGKAVVRVEADLDFTKRTRQAEVFDPTRTATNKAVSDDESYVSDQPNAMGTVTSAPLGNNPASSTKSQYNHKQGSKDISVSREITSETDAPGAVKRMTVSVLLDPDLVGSTSSAQVQRLVENAVGFDSQRGDKIAVEFLAFNKSAQTPYKDPTAAAAAAAQRTKMIVGGAIAGVLLLAVLLLGFVLLRDKRRRKKSDADSDDDIATRLTMATPGMLPGTVDPTGQLSVPSRSAGEADRLLERVGERPEDAAKVLRGLIASDQVGGQR